MAGQAEEPRLGGGALTLGQRDLGGEEIEPRPDLMAVRRGRQAARDLLLDQAAQSAEIGNGAAQQVEALRRQDAVEVGGGHLAGELVLGAGVARGRGCRIGFGLLDGRRAPAAVPKALAQFQPGLALPVAAKPSVRHQRRRFPAVPAAQAEIQRGKIEREGDALAGLGGLDASAGSRHAWIERQRQLHGLAQFIRPAFLTKQEEEQCCRPERSSQFRRPPPPPAAAHDGPGAATPRAAGRRPVA